MSDLNSRELLANYRDGQSDAATAIFDRYVQRLIALARSRISTKFKPRFDAEDVVQSAFRSFFVHAKNEEYLLSSSGDLWRLLASITLNKLYGQIEKQTAAKRTIHHELLAHVSPGDVKIAEPTAAEIVAVVEELHLALNNLSSDERAVFTLTLQGQTNDQISKSLGKSDRTVRRLQASARALVEQRLLSPKPSAAGKRTTLRTWGNDANAPLLYSAYRLEQILGSGGMGKVYRARELGSDKLVAIKALHKLRQTDERAVRQFVQEAHILSTLRHSNIVGIQGLGRFPHGGYFIVMDFIPGIDLQKRLAKEPLSVGDAIAIVSQVAAAIQHAHENHVIHCDLKPGNIVVDDNYKATVTDFGFAYFLTSNSQLYANAVGGTAGYIAPEIIGGQSPTPAADIYGLGALFWALVSGAPPRDVSSLTTGKVPPVISKFCARCLAINQTQRFANVAEFIRELNRLEKGE